MCMKRFDRALGDFPMHRVMVSLIRLQREIAVLPAIGFQRQCART